MRKQLSKSATTLFKINLERRLPQFYWKERLQGLGSDVFCCELRPDLFGIIHFYPSPKNDSFYVELGASFTPEYPVRCRMAHGDEIYEVPSRFRLPRLWVSGVREPKWWLVRDTVAEGFFSGKQPGVQNDYDWYQPPLDEVLPNVPAIVENAIDMIVLHGVPYFRKISMLNGLDWDELFPPGSGHPDTTLNEPNDAAKS